MDEITSVLKVKDENGNWVGIPAIKGEKGDAGEGLVATDTNNDGNVVLSFE